MYGLLAGRFGRQIGLFVVVQWDCGIGMDSELINLELSEKKNIIHPPIFNQYKRNVSNSGLEIMILNKKRVYFFVANGPNVYTCFLNEN